MNGKFECQKEISPMDFFNGSISPELLAAALQENDARSVNGPDRPEFYEANVAQYVKYINEFMLDRTGELPHTVRFFSTPDIEGGLMHLGAVAKVENNGQTFVFTDDYNFAEMIAAHRH